MDGDPWWFDKLTNLIRGDIHDSAPSLREFFLVGDGFALDELALGWDFFIFKALALDGATHHACFALEACALCGGVHDACSIVGGHSLDGFGFLSVSRGHFRVPSFVKLCKVSPARWPG